MEKCEGAEVKKYISGIPLHPDTAALLENSFFLFKLFITFLYNRLYIYKNTKKKNERTHQDEKKKNDEYCYRHIYEDNMPESYGQDLKTKKTSTATR